MWRIIWKRSTGTQSSTEPETESSNFWIGLRTLEERRQERVTEIIKRDWNIDLKTAFIMVTYTIHTALQGPRSRVYLGFKLGKNRISLFWSESKFSVLSTYLVLQRLRKNLKFLAATSSSRSDDVTPRVSLSVTLFFLAVNFAPLHLCTLHL